MAWAVTVGASGGPAARGGGPTGAGPGQLAGGAASLLSIEDPETGSGSDSESEPPVDQDPPERDSAFESEA